jgi:OmpA-OmpF porin, OOP family
LFQTVVAQSVIEKNYIPNSSFENYKKQSGNIKSAIPWNGIASVDYYQQPIPNDTSAYRGAHTGQCYAGLRFQKKYKEFLQVKLAEPLRRGQKYQLEYWIRFGFWSNAWLRSLGAYFSKGGYQGPLNTSARNVVDTVFRRDSLSLIKLQWIKVTGIYIADGGEKFITIGNFAMNIQKDMARINVFKMGFKEAYYFIDDISLKWIKPNDEIPTEWVGSFINDTTKALDLKKEIKVGEKIPLPNITFEKGHSYITPQSYAELNRLAQFLFKHPEIVIQINGHSDNTGGKFKNQKISEQRARMVFEYLISKGVQNKMSFKGFGSDFPVATNDSEEGKAKNRRVEFEILKSGL